MRIRQIPIFQDNYCHLLIDDGAGVAAAIDPAEPGPVRAALDAEGVRLTHVLCTHHHWDHSGGNAEMAARIPGVEVLGSVQDAAKTPALTRQVSGGETVTVGGLRGSALFVPCHTRGHVAYLFGDALFCGDTLFVAGCGRFFEGDAREMHAALNEVFACLPGETRVFCGHEYTVANLEFAASVDPENPAVAAKLAWARAQREAGRSTVPSTLAEERTYNPFLRVHAPAIQAATGETDPVAVMSRLRALKNAR